VAIYFGVHPGQLKAGLAYPNYIAARPLCLQVARTDGIDKALAQGNLDAIIAPSYSNATSPAAIAVTLTFRYRSA
jgi:hypothetical protein